MEKSKIDENEVVVLGPRDQIVKLLICTTVGFTATKIVESLFDAAIKHRLTKNLAQKTS